MNIRSKLYWLMKEKPYVREEYLKDLGCSIFYLSKEAFMIINLEKNDMILRREIYENIYSLSALKGVPYELLKKGEWFLFTEESYRSKAELLSNEIYKTSIGLVKSDRLRSQILKLSQTDE